ncbi:hypothetical protein [Okeania sp. SIO2B9]|uniref:hypothetical protein n=1 Tax=Okeania sp. SIO2B9 TaxID=2607782 RepID=UPI00257EBE6A|nr:hypothetical protein [Okeania sp. SIO2B9]
MRTDRQLKTQTTLFQLSVISHQSSVLSCKIFTSSFYLEEGVRSQPTPNPSPPGRGRTSSGGKIAWG